MVFSIAPTPHSKGLLFLRPDEADLLSFFPKSTLKSVQQKFIILIHYCTYFEKQVAYDWVDIYLYPKNGVKWIKSPRRYLNLSTRNFLETSEFTSQSSIVQRDIDLIFISNLSACKHVDQWLTTLIDLSIHNPSLTTLSIIPLTSDSRCDLKRCKEILSNLPARYASNHSICFLERHPAAPLYPLANNIVQSFLNRSKVLVHFSDYEGECRVITEALASGCMVSAYKNMKGAALEPLDSTNSVLYEDYSVANEAILKALNTAYKLQPKTEILKSRYSKIPSITCLVDFIESEFDCIDKSYLFSELSKINLKYALAGHDWTIPSKVEGKHYLGTLQDAQAMQSYLKACLGIAAPLRTARLNEAKKHLVTKTKSFFYPLKLLMGKAIHQNEKTSSSSFKDSLKSLLRM
jgi:hypothetical protein